MKLMIGSDKAAPEALKSMKTSPCNFADTKWYAYQNHDLGHYDIGHLQFLAVGSQNTFKDAPNRMPDTRTSLGWRYIKVGIVNLESGEVNDLN